ncbi:hypothetical protein VTJ49DRAFT_4056 [Mycothermus thermophilus]|uniref:Uncharacterized protein n=1 Tax=Humicola insolens TaxID=85995 RepID=A0ABR3V6C6_HUMIN
METFNSNLLGGLEQPVQPQGSHLRPPSQRQPQLLGTLPPLPAMSVRPRDPAMPALIGLTPDEVEHACQVDVSRLPELSSEERAKQRQLDLEFVTLLLQQQQQQPQPQQQQHQQQQLLSQHQQQQQQQRQQQQQQQQQPSLQPRVQPRPQSPRQPAQQQSEQQPGRKRNRYKSSPEDDLEELERKQRLRQLRVRNMKTWQEGAVADLQVAASCASSASAPGFGTLGFGTLAPFPSAAATSAFPPSLSAPAAFVPAGVLPFGSAVAPAPASASTSWTERAPLQAQAILRVSLSASASGGSRPTRTTEGQLARSGSERVPQQRSVHPAAPSASRSPRPAPDQAIQRPVPAPAPAPAAAAVAAAAIPSRAARSQTPATPATTLVAPSPSSSPSLPAVPAAATKRQPHHSRSASASTGHQSRPAVAVSPAPVVDGLCPPKPATQQQQQQPVPPRSAAPEQTPATTATTLVPPSPHPDPVSSQAHAAQPQPVPQEEQTHPAAPSPGVIDEATLAALLQAEVRRMDGGSGTAAGVHDAHGVEGVDASADAQQQDFSWVLTDEAFATLFDVTAQADDVLPEGTSAAAAPGPFASAPEEDPLAFDADAIGIWTSHRQVPGREDPLVAAVPVVAEAEQAENATMATAAGPSWWLPPAPFVPDEEGVLDEDPLGLF